MNIRVTGTAVNPVHIDCILSVVGFSSIRFSGHRSQWQTCNSQWSSEQNPELPASVTEPEWGTTERLTDEGRSVVRGVSKDVRGWGQLGGPVVTGEEAVCFGPQNLYIYTGCT